MRWFSKVKKQPRHKHYAAGYMEFICFAFAMPLIANRAHPTSPPPSEVAVSSNYQLHPRHNWRGQEIRELGDAQMLSLGNMVLMFAILCAGYIIFINELNGTIDWRVLMLAVGAVLVGIAARYLLGGEGKD